MDSVTTLATWKKLGSLAQRAPSIETCAQDDARNTRLNVQAVGVQADFIKQRVDNEILDTLQGLAAEVNLEEQRSAMFAGEHINNSEDRPALHTALRTPREEGLPAYAGQVHDTLQRVQLLVGKLWHGQHLGYTGKAITDIVHIGIGGSHLGPELAASALQQRNRFNVHYVANIDGHAITEVLAKCHPEKTAFFVVSKSFSTLETLSNAEASRAWFMERGGSKVDIAKHFFAISANVEQAAEFGVPESNVFPMWDWVGGRYSVWSAVGIPIALACGNSAFTEFLAGAHSMDEHFLNAPIEQNLPVLAALFGIWNTNFLGANNHAVLAYDERLSLLPLYLQQLETESNGKSVRLDGQAVDTHTMPILWGGVGTTGQHAYHQLLHQGTRAFSADFILAKAPHHELAEHHRWLQANALAQSQAMMIGDDTPQPERHVAGNHPTTTLLLERIDPHHLGALLAMYEHKVFCQGVIWGINSFDQWGVELGKRLAGPIYGQLAGNSVASQDASTQNLVRALR